MPKKISRSTYVAYSSCPNQSCKDETSIAPDIRAGIKKWAGHSIRRLAAILKKPELPYLELHLTDHCNLNCKGCLHFSPIAAERYASLRRYKKDIRRLKYLFFNIQTIRLMGGEPLLHPDAASFIAETRKAFPRSNIRVVTNGILLPTASEAFFETCRETGTVIDLTIYPPFTKNIASYRELLQGHKVPFKLYVTERFYAMYNFKGNSDIDKTFYACKKRFNCPFLQDGVIYHCAGPALVHYFSQEFNHDISGGKGINIYSPFITGHLINKRLRKPIEFCRWCSTEYTPFSWTLSRWMIGEWDAEAQKKALKAPRERGSGLKSGPNQSKKGGAP